MREAGEWGNNGPAALAGAAVRSPPETRVAKEAKETDRLGWKTPRLSYRAEKGLQCGLSGNRVQALATCLPEHQRETAVTGNGRLLPGEIQPDLSRKIYLFRRRRLSRLHSFPSGGTFLSDIPNQKYELLF